MRSRLLWSSALWVAASSAHLQLDHRQLPLTNSSSIAATSSAASSSSSASSSSASSSSASSSSASSSSASSSSASSSSSSSSSTSASTTSFTSLLTSSTSASSSQSTSLRSSSNSSTSSGHASTGLSTSGVSVTISSHSSSDATPITSNSSHPFPTVAKSGSSNSSFPITTNHTLPTQTVCTGCVLEALNPYTITFPSKQSSLWTSLVVTQTILTLYITYEQDGGVTTEYETLNVTKTVAGLGNATNLFTHSTPVFTWEPEFGITLTLEEGPTYVAYTQLYGGLDSLPTPVETGSPATTGLLPTASPGQSCDAHVSRVIVYPSNAEQYSAFLQTYTAGAPNVPDESPVSLPPAALSYLKQSSKIQSIFSGSDIGSCTLRPTSTYTPVSTAVSSSAYFSAHTSPSSSGEGPAKSFHPSPGTSEVASEVVPSNAPDATPPPNSYIANPPEPSDTSTYLSTTYESTSSHTTREGCLRCNAPQTPIAESVPANQPPGTPNLKSPNSPEVTPAPQPQPQPQPNNPGQSVTIGSAVLPIQPVPWSPAQPQNSNPSSPQNPENPQNPSNPGNPQNPSNPENPSNPSNPQNPSNQQTPENPSNAVVIGSQTLTPGQAATINGVLVSVPANGASSLVVGSNTIAVSPAAASTGPAILTAGDQTLTANSQGQFVIGDKTLSAGGPALTSGGTTYSLGPSGSVAVVNGVSQTLGNAPLATGPAVMTVGSQTLTANSQGQFIIDGQTLSPGGSALTKDGTTFSLGPSGSVAVVNGVTQTLGNAPAVTGPPTLTFQGSTIPATVVGGTTEFVIAPGQTLTPGGQIVAGGTTFSMPKDGSGSTVVVNGVTQTLSAAAGVPVLTLNNQAVSATVVGGTTEFIIGSQTLTPGGQVVVSGTTLSMPSTASGSVVVINGITSTLGKGPITAAPQLTIGGKTYAPTVRDGTTEYVLGPGLTLRPGSSIVSDGTTFSLDAQGTALVINGQTSSIPRTPANNTASTTGSSSRSGSSSFSSATSARDPGNFIASGIGATSKKSEGGRAQGLDKWAEGVVMGLAGWMLMFL